MDPLDPLDAPERVHEVRRILAKKPALRAFYREVYGRFSACLARCPERGVVLELGSGAGFVRECIPDALTSDVVPYAGLDLVADGTRLPFRDGAVRLICMVNVFHHVPNPAAFLAEAQRCLMPGGRLFMVDQHVGPLSRPVLNYLHHEPFNPRAADWAFPSTGPLSGANGALAWIVFHRDRERLARDFPGLELVRYAPHSPLRYWLTGGLKDWSLLPGWAYGPATALDRTLSALWPALGSFTDVELVRRAQGAVPGKDPTPVA